MAVFSSDLAALLRAFLISAIRTRFLADLIFGKPNTSFGKIQWIFSTVQNGILAGNFLKIKCFFIFFLLFYSKIVYCGLKRKS
jgi:hypothetical protein